MNLTENGGSRGLWGKAMSIEHCPLNRPAANPPAVRHGLPPAALNPLPVLLVHCLSLLQVCFGCDFEADTCGMRAYGTTGDPQTREYEAPSELPPGCAACTAVAAAG